MRDLDGCTRAVGIGQPDGMHCDEPCLRELFAPLRKAQVIDGLRFSAVDHVAGQAAPIAMPLRPPIETVSQVSFVFGSKHKGDPHVGIQEGRKPAKGSAQDQEHQVRSLRVEIGGLAERF